MTDTIITGTTGEPVRALGSDVVVEGLTVSYGDYRAVHDVGFTIAAGTTLALVGESGSGKSTVAHAVSRLLPPGATVDAGRVSVDGRDILAIRGRELRRMRGSKVAYLAQDALAALNPVVRIGRQIGEIYAVRGGSGRAEARDRAVAALAQVNIDDPERVAHCFPHQLSGGMRQRVMIAMALASEPELLVADEPTTALDVTVQAEILALIVDLQARNGLTVLWITHDMSVVAEMADSVAVMYGGRLLESGDVYSVFDGARQPYTRRLLDCFTSGRADAHKEPLRYIPGSPAARAPRAGCPFAPRCDSADDRCRSDAPALVEVGGGHRLACHHPEPAGTAVPGDPADVPAPTIGEHR